ncbi:MAG: hypothetical protein HOW73_25880 [Polyangiaceae bacterium]|nr:hypothetical protein [Polyangiaceae bacterium]
MTLRTLCTLAATAALLMGCSSPPASQSSGQPSEAASTSAPSPIASASPSSPGSADAPVPNSSQPIGPVKRLVFGGANLCGIMPSGKVLCAGEWPLAFETPTSIGSRNQYFHRALEIPNLGEVTSVALGTDRGCATHPDGTVSCWGNNHPTQNGWFGAEPNALSPAPVAGITDAVELALTGTATCALTRSQKVVCWGPSMILTGRKEGPPPASRTIAIDGAVQIDGSWKQACAVTKQGKVGCWGDARSGLLGDVGAPQDERRVYFQSGIPAVEEVSVASYHICAREREGSIWCWGNNGGGLLGDGTLELRQAPVRVHGITNAAQVAISSSLSCARTRDGKVLCWGENANCDLGSKPAGCIEREMMSTMGSSKIQLCPEPQLIPLSIVPKSIAVGETSACAWDESGAVECWGRNLMGGPLSCKPEPWAW